MEKNVKINLCVVDLCEKKMEKQTMKFLVHDAEKCGLI